MNSFKILVNQLMLSKVSIELICLAVIVAAIIIFSIVAAAKQIKRNKQKANGEADV